MKFLKRATFVIILLMIAGGGFYFTKGFIQPDQKKSINEQPKIDHNMTAKPTLTEDKVMKQLPNLGLQAESAILMEANSGDILYEKNTSIPLPTASMSKMMTELLVLRAIQDHKVTWDQSVSISEYVSAISNHPGFASVHLNKGQSYTVRELFNAMAIHSANGATIALAETVAGSEKNFVEKMNETAMKLGLEHTHFVDSTGLNNSDLGSFAEVGAPNDTNIMSASDVAMLAKQLIQQFPEILHVVDEPKFTFDQHTYTNTNWMLPKINKQNVGFVGVDGLKTGYTDEAGYCFVGTVKRHGTRLISVVMGASSKVARFSETERLYETAYSQIGDN